MNHPSTRPRFAGTQSHRRGRLQLGVCAGIALAAVMPAQGAIVSWSSQTVFHPTPPASVGSLTLGVQFAHAWDEKQGITVSGLQVDILGNTGNSNFPVGGALSGVVDSHMVHNNGNWPFGVFRSGTVTFNNPIVGVIFSFQNLNVSDAMCGPVGTTYSHLSGRGLTPFVDYISVSGSTLSYKFALFPSYHTGWAEVRVLTAMAPTPGTAGLLAMAGLVGMRRRR